MIRDWLFGTSAKHALVTNALSIGVLIGYLGTAPVQHFWWRIAALAVLIMSIPRAVCDWRRLP
jgi:hypothetical protein